MSSRFWQSTGDSSISSGSAGERSASPARSDESAEERPTPQALSPASSSGTLTNASCPRDAARASSVSLHTSSAVVHASPTRMSRPVSMISLNRSRKRPAPVPPQREVLSKEGHRQGEDSPSKIHVNGKVNRPPVQTARVFSCL